MTDIYQQVFENNRKWVQSKTSQDPHYFLNMAKDQSPAFLYIGCADSRVPANEIMGLEPGEVFVHRNIANIVECVDLNVQSVIEYSVEHLKVEHIVVCGHYGCGGVKAAMQPKDLGILNGWLRNIRDVYRLHKEELNQITDEDARYRRLIELNVQEQCINVIKTAVVQKNYLQNKRPVVHGWVYDLAQGELIDLKIDFDAILEEIREIYSLNEYGILPESRQKVLSKTA